MLRECALDQPPSRCCQMHDAGAPVVRIVLPPHQPAIRKAIHRRGWVTGLLWTSDTPSADAARRFPFKTGRFSVHIYARTPDRRDGADLRARMFPVTALSGATGHAESTATVRRRVLAARSAAAERWAGQGWRTNAEVPGPVLRTRFALPRSAVRPLDAGLRAGELTARGADRALRVAWTLADLAGRARPDQELVETALFFRDRRAA